MDGSELLVIGGRSGVGKSAAAHALHALLRDADVRHAVIEGDAWTSRGRPRGSTV